MNSGLKESVQRLLCALRPQPTPRSTRNRQRAGLAAAVLAALASILFITCSSAAKDQDPFRVLVINPSIHGDRIAHAFDERLNELIARESKSTLRPVRIHYDGPMREQSQLEAQVRQAVVSGVDLLICMTEFAIESVKTVDPNGTTPVLFWLVRDPVAAGLAQSAQRPGGRFSGVTTGFAGSLSEGRRLQYLVELNPDIKRIYVPHNPEDVAVAQSIETIRKAATDLGAQLLERHVRTEQEARTAAKEIPEAADAVMLLPDRVIGTARIDLAEAAVERGIALSGPVENSVHDGALMAYAFREDRIGHQLARMAFEVVRGTPVSEMPLETPEFSLSLNLATAAAIGLDVPDSVVRQAELLVRE